MKLLKTRPLVWLLMLLLLFSRAFGEAFPETLQAALEQEGISSTLYQVESGTWMLCHTYNHGVFGERELRWYFREGEEGCTLVLWDLLNGQQMETLLPLLNELNTQSPYFTFVFDTSDSSVYLYADPLFAPEDCARVCLEYLAECGNALDLAAGLLATD